MSDARAAAGPHKTAMTALRRAGGEANREKPSDARAAAGPHKTTMTALRRAGGSDISRYRGGASREKP